MERKTSSGKLDEGPLGTAAAIRDGKGLWAAAPSCYGHTLSRGHQPLHRCHTWSQLRMTMQSVSHTPAVPTAMQQCPPGTHGSTHSRGAASPGHPRQHTGSEAAAGMLLRTMQGERKAQDRAKRLKAASFCSQRDTTEPLHLNPSPALTRAEGRVSSCSPRADVVQGLTADSIARLSRDAQPVTHHRQAANLGRFWRAASASLSAQRLCITWRCRQGSCWPGAEQSPLPPRACLFLHSPSSLPRFLLPAREHI